MDKKLFYLLITGIALVCLIFGGVLVNKSNKPEVSFVEGANQTGDSQDYLSQNFFISDSSDLQNYFRSQEKEDFFKEGIPELIFSGNSFKSFYSNSFIFPENRYRLEDSSLTVLSNESTSKPFEFSLLLNPKISFPNDSKNLEGVYPSGDLIYDPFSEADFNTLDILKSSQPKIQLLAFVSCQDACTALGCSSSGAACAAADGPPCSDFPFQDCAYESGGYSCGYDGAESVSCGGLTPYCKCIAVACQCSLGACCSDGCTYDPEGTDTGTCRECDGAGSERMPADDSACGTIDCDGLNYYYQTGTQGATTTEYCYYRNYVDITSNRCEGLGDCKDANTADCTSYSNGVKYQCGTCKFIDNAVCTAQTQGSCSYYPSGYACGTGYECDGAGNCVATDTCSCPGLNQNWEIDLGDYCVISSNCDLGTGVLSFVNAGSVTFNARIDAADMGQPPASGTVYMGASGIIYLG